MKTRLVIPGLSALSALTALLLSALPAIAANNLPAFPGAEGFGALATGGRGGEIYHVTNLTDAGTGSFRDAVSKGPRIVVFDVSGYIELQSAVSVANDISIEGQTAPGQGISTKNYEVSFSKSHNIIVRYMHFRQGLTPKQEKKYAVALEESTNVILDHCSIQFGRWDCIGTNKGTEITIQDSIIGPGVAPQRFGCLCESDDITFSHNLWISNQSRNPKSKGIVQYVNNVVYNWGVTGYVGGHSGAAHVGDVIANYFIKGPSSSNVFAGEFKNTDQIYQKDNFVDLDMNGALDGHLAQPDDFGKGDSRPTMVGASGCHPPIAVTLDTATAAEKKVEAGAGDSLSRDSVDTTLIGWLASYGKAGTTIDDPAKMGGFGTLQTGPAKIKTGEGDAIPDQWKAAHRMSGDAKADSGNGYTNIEVFVNSLVPAPAPAAAGGNAMQ
jgi:pectate lyase